MTLAQRETAEVAAANESGRQPVVFIHGLWLLAGSWDSWRQRFEESGYATVAADWPDDPVSVEAGRADPAAFAGKSVGAITEHVAELIGSLAQQPIVIGHSIGGLVAQKLAGMGLALATVAIDPAAFRGVLPLPVSALRSVLPVVGNPANYRRHVMLSPQQFRYSFTNAVSEQEAAALYDEFAVPGSGIPLFQLATANLNPATECTVDSRNPERGPLLIISGEKDHIVPWALANGAFKRQRRNDDITEIAEIAGRGHSLVIDSGWPAVADAALEFLGRTATG